MHRLRGETDAAETAYRGASKFGREPQPGLALLRLAQGDITSARASIQRVVAETQAPTRRCRVLAAFAAISLAAGDLDAATKAADELSATASASAPPLLVALAAQTEGAVVLARGDARGALRSLRNALTIWQELGAPYESARARALIGTACRQLGDEDAARLEFDESRVAFEALGAAPDVVAVDALANAVATGGPRPGGLTTREVEVLKLVARGLSNHDVAVELVISDHTVRRHLQNIFAKTGVSSRAAATAYAFEHGLA